MVDSKEFAVGIFDALARRRRQNLQRVTKEELRDFWLQISDQSFDARLQIFFDMYVRPSQPPTNHVVPLFAPTRAGGSRISCCHCQNKFQGGHQRRREDHEGGSAGGAALIH